MSADRRNPTVEIDRDVYEKIQNLAKEEKKKVKPFINELLGQFIEKGPLIDEWNTELRSRLDRLEMKSFGATYPSYAKSRRQKRYTQKHKT